MRTQKYLELRRIITQVLIIMCYLHGALPGANDLHLQDGSSTVDAIAGDVFFEIIDPPELRYSYRIRPAKDFGAVFNDGELFKNIRLVPTVPVEACTKIVNRKDVFGQVALIERGECSFVLKSHQAELAGARAVIITETPFQRPVMMGPDRDESLDLIIEMVDDKMDYEVHIPSGFLVGRSGSYILSNLRKLRKKYAIINLPVNMTYVALNKMKQPPWTSL